MYTTHYNKDIKLYSYLVTQLHSYRVTHLYGVAGAVPHEVAVDGGEAGQVGDWLLRVLGGLGAVFSQEPGNESL